jgi:hypothetical protein
MLLFSVVTDSKQGDSSTSEPMKQPQDEGRSNETTSTKDNETMTTTIATINEQQIPSSVTAEAIVTQDMEPKNQTEVEDKDEDDLFGKERSLQPTDDAAESKDKFDSFDERNNDLLRKILLHYVSLRLLFQVYVIKKVREREREREINKFPFFNREHPSSFKSATTDRI